MIFFLFFFPSPPIIKKNFLSKCTRCLADSMSLAVVARVVVVAARVIVVAARVIVVVVAARVIVVVFAARVASGSLLEVVVGVSS